jgi:transglutaminase-like putative cysteine protease
MRRLLLLVLFLPTLAFARGEFDVRSAPAWAERLPVDMHVSASARDIRGGIYAILVDHQCLNGTADYYRDVRKVLTPSAVQNASEVSFDFDPSYEHLVIHDIAVIRGGETIHELDPRSIRVIEKESDKSNRIYDGMLTAIAFVKDVRPGDVLDYSWSIEGENPLLGGKYADSYDLTSDVPARLIRHRLIFPASRALRTRSTVRGIEPRIEARDQSKIYTWERRDVPALDVEDNLPDWFDPYDHIQLSEFASWSEVAHWADALFQLDDESRDAVVDLADRIRSENKTRDAQIIAAIRFVQDDIRYLGIEMGRNSHEPHQPADVLDQRWGDCKDKSFLLASLLRELGVEAYPSMVNTKLRRSLDDELPSPFNFDHVIDQVIENGKVRWIDPTLADQGGTLDTLETPNDERALVIRTDTTSLARIVTNQNGATTVDQTFDAKSWDGPASLVVRSTYTGAAADATRADLAATSNADLAKERLNRLAADLPRIKADGPLTISDDRAKNVITITARYIVRDLFKDGDWSYTPRAIEDHIKRPETSIRSMPIAFVFPLNLTETMTFHLPSVMHAEEGDNVIEDAAFHYESHVARNGSTLTIRHVLRSRNDGVPAAAVPEHLTRLNEVSEQLGTTVSRNGSGVSLASAAGSFGWVALAFAALVMIAIAAIRRRMIAGSRSYRT